MATFYREEPLMDKMTWKLPGQTEVTEVRFQLENDRLNIQYEDRTFEGLIVSQQAGEGILEHDNQLLPYYYCWLKTASGDNQLQVWISGKVYTLEPVETSGRRGRGAGASTAASGEIKAPMPGKVLQIPVAEGDHVEANQTLVVMESMKMEMTLTAPAAGTVATIACQPGNMVEMGTVLIKVKTMPNGSETP